MEGGSGEKDARLGEYLEWIFGEKAFFVNRKTSLVYSNNSLLQQITYSNPMHSPPAGRVGIIPGCNVEHALYGIQMD